MKLWLLRPVDDWEPWYDKAFGFVVRAETEGRARELASADAGNEGAGVWLNADETTCEELSDDGPEAVVIQDFKSA